MRDLWQSVSLHHRTPNLEEQLQGLDSGETQPRALTDAGETRFARVLDAVFDKLFLGRTVVCLLII